MGRLAEAYINLANLRHNLALANQLAGRGQCIAVVKANAYGHGLVDIARALQDEVCAFGVACLSEAEALRAAGVANPILLLEGVFDTQELQRALELRCWLVLANRQQVEQLLNEAKQQSLPSTKVFVKVDTGMHRLGLMPAELDDSMQRLLALRRLDVVIMTHLARADELDSDFTARQLQLFNELRERWPVACSIANSAALMFWPEARCEWNRPGYLLYGNCPVPANTDYALRPVMTLRSRIIALRDIEPGDSVGYCGTWTAQRASRIATVAVGYGDGYPRTARNGTPVLIRGREFPTVGRVSMDMLGVDVTDAPELALGEPVELWGENLSVNRVAECAGTIGYELLAGMPARVPRRYV